LGVSSVLDEVALAATSSLQVGAIGVLVEELLETALFLLAGATGGLLPSTP
jgi:hypothetical protein